MQHYCGYLKIENKKSLSKRQAATLHVIKSKQSLELCAFFQVMVKTRKDSRHYHQ